MISDKNKLTEWKKRVVILDVAELKLKEALDNKKISKVKYNNFKRILGKAWIKNWDYYPEKNPSIEKAFDLNFG
jgi:hypothetical protein